MKILLGIILTAIIANANCFDKDRLKSIELFEKAFKKSNVNIKNLRDFSKNNDTAVIVTFDDGSKRGLIWYDEKCNATSLKVSSGYGTVTMYYYQVVGKKLKLIKTRKNKY